jgi:hypothetical protein
MSGILTLDKGSPNWWTSQDIWVQPHGSPDSGPPGVVAPIAGESYDVWVRVHNLYSEASDPDWNLFVEWAIPTAGYTPITAANILNGEVLMGVANGLPIGSSVPATSHLDVKAATTWVPAFENGGHECLLAVVYDSSEIGTVPVEPGGPLGSLNGDATANESWSISQHNLGVVELGSGKSHRFQYPIRVTGVGEEEHEFVVVAQQAALSEIAAFLPGLPGGRTILQHPSKLEHLGIARSADPGPRELEAARPRIERVRIRPGEHHIFTLSGSLREGNALINVTQHLGARVVGGLSVLVLTEAK